jgi:hypothetical protein
MPWWVGPDTGLSGHQARDKLFLPIEGTFTREPIGFAVRKGDLDTLNFSTTGSPMWLPKAG